MPINMLFGGPKDFTKPIKERLKLFWKSFARRFQLVL